MSRVTSEALKPTRFVHLDSHSGSFLTASLVETFTVMSLHPKPSSSTSFATEFDILRDSHKFLRHDNDLAESHNTSWNDQLAQKYYDNLFREFAVCDLKHYKSGNVCTPLFVSLSLTSYAYSLLYVGEPRRRCCPGREKTRVAIRAASITPIRILRSN